MILTGFTDEASSDLDTQIKVTEDLGWTFLSARTVGDANIHDISENDFKKVGDKLQNANIKVAEFGTLIGNWSKSIHSDWKITYDEVVRSINRMHKLDVKYARIMSYAQEPWGENQFEKERFKRLKLITEMFRSEGLVAVHENCMNWGGFSPEHTLILLNEVPDLKLVFDTGNPVFQKDRSKPEPYPWQDSLEFYHLVKEAVAHIHAKDCLFPVDGVDTIYVFPGEGDGNVKEILSDLKTSGYKGFIAIEPHMAKVFHHNDGDQNEDWQYNVYIEYGKMMETLIRELL